MLVLKVNCFKYVTDIVGLSITFLLLLILVWKESGLRVQCQEEALLIWILCLTKLIWKLSCLKLLVRLLKIILLWCRLVVMIGSKFRLSKRMLC
jgi:hypothetical protein